MNARLNVLEAAYEVLRESGARGLTLRAVARKAGVTPMAIYRHYSDKEDLVNALVADGLSAWESRLQNLRGMTPSARIESAFDLFLDFALSEPEKFEAAFMVSAPGARRFPEDFAADRSPAGSILVAELRRARRKGEIAGPPALEGAITLWALAQGLISLYRAGRFSGGEREFRTTYRRAMRRCLSSFAEGRSA